MILQPIITIDGPAASGKSTTARLVASALGWRYLDTGAMYRAVAYVMLTAGLDPADERDVCAELTRHTVDLGPGDPPVVLLDGEDVSSKIRDAAVSQASSRVAVIPCVRGKLVEVQQRIGARGPCVLEGRDTGTVVFPDAGLKIYLDAPAGQRAERRLKELGDSAVMTLEEMVEEVRRRDERDRNRTHSPLLQAVDAVVVNTGGLTIEEQVARVLELARERFRIPA